MRLLYVTDHRFHQTAEGVFDIYCFNRAFFADHLRVFENVTVLARMIHDEPPPGSQRSDGDGLEFDPLPNWGGLKWMFGLPLLCRNRVKAAVNNCDAVCLRLPAASGLMVFNEARRQGKPVMFELSGDPELSLDQRQHGPLAKLIGKLSARGVRKVTRHAVAGSYVSVRHLQGRYPAGPQTVTESISSIQLPAETVQPPKVFDGIMPKLRLVLVASLQAVKCHDVLLRGVAQAKQSGTAVSLQLVGGGPLQNSLQSLVRELGIIEAVTFHGHIADPLRIREILDESDLFVMTSASEGMPRAMLEAMARGLPALGSQVGGIAELLDAEQTFESGDWRQLGNLFQQIQQNPALLTLWAGRSHHTVKSYTQDVLSQRRRKLLAALRSAAEKRA